MLSKKIKNNLETGLWVEDGSGTVCAVSQDWEFNEEEVSKPIVMTFGHGEMPPHQRIELSEEEIEQKMRDFEPDLRKWKTARE